jgi:hypothetical protein
MILIMRVFESALIVFLVSVNLEVEQKTVRGGGYRTYTEYESPLITPTRITRP